MSTTSGIGSFGSTALLVSSMTGPGLSTIPAMFQQSGWAAPVFIFIIVAFLSGCSALFVCEALSNIRGNEKFQAKVELTTIAQVYLGKKYHYFFQIMLFIALQAVNVSSIILAAQTFDGMLITIFKGTCGLGVSPGGWFCQTSQVTEGNSPFPSSDYYIFTFGYLLTLVMVMPLGFFSLVENIAVQMTSFIVLIGILIQWLVAFGQNGFDPSLLPASGANSTTVLGIVIFNYSYITTIPSWVNSLKPNVNIHKVLWISVIISTIFYILLGICGAMAYQMSASSDILAILSQNGSTASLVTCYLFPVAALVTSIPVFTIVIRSNLLRGQICSRPWAVFWSNFLPWFVCIPLQTKDYIGTIQNWSSLFFQSTVNFILPFVLYFVSRRVVASVEPYNQQQEAAATSGLALPMSPKAASSIGGAVDEQTEEEKKNSVVMYNPEDDCSISIRRSNIAPSNKLSRLEQQSHFSRSPKFPLGSRVADQSVISHSMFSPPTSPRYGANDPQAAAVIPTIVCSEIETEQAKDSPRIDTSRPPTSPTMLVTTTHVDSPRLSTASSAGNTGSTLASAKGLGITDSNSTPIGAASTTTTDAVIVSSPTDTQQPQSKRLQPQSPKQRHPAGSLSPDMSRPAPSSPTQQSQQQQHRHHPTSTYQQTPHSPTQQGTNNPHSMIASVLSVRSSVVTPYEHGGGDGQIDEKIVDETLKQDDDLEDEQTQEDMLRGKFIAFKKRKRFNPFYLAVLSSGVMGIAIVFMIIYDVTLLGLGNDVFG
ncbi:transmembrane amino acid transporter protein-domain-containing protein [Halteromyces radiatus]|uniref:transmembrane amino acid transporter protein-domain-containing protein n=1 Tax=Halteromyces radiatus TaxID=101107 RepID=UPI0022201C33|nr:transmembrane amino acid transporter protein-domain-containing protein [Halteromyces radiatus]KAI8084453.1 transmembrane amino acid transporter protein-domain-containing protein [Halteromyces radiatus]